MAASEDIWLVHLLYLRLNMFAYIVAAPLVMALAFFRESELGHDGAEAAGLWTLLQVAVGDDLGGNLRESEEFRTGILETGGRVVDGDEFFLAGRNHEGLDMLSERINVVDLEPVVASVTSARTANRPLLKR